MFVQKVFKNEETVLYHTPGMLLETSNTGTESRGIHTKYEYFYHIVDDDLLQVDKDYNKTTLGSLSSYTGQVKIVSTNNQLFMTDRTDGYVYDILANTLTTISDPDFIADTRTIAALAERCITHSGPIFYWSDSSDATSWDGDAAFATAEGIQENIEAVHVFQERLYVMGSTQTEIWQTGTTDAEPFTAVSGIIIPYGCMAPDSLANSADYMFFLGKGKNGKLAIVSIDRGFNYKAVSDQGPTFAIQDYDSPDDATAYCYQLENKEFYVISFNTANKTWQYDIDLGIWTELEYNNADRHRSQYHAAFNNKTLVTSIDDANIYSLDKDTLTDNGTMIVRKMRSPVLNDSCNKQFIDQLICDFAHNTILHTGDGSNPVVMLRMSNDGGYSFHSARHKTIGTVGDYKNKTRWTRVGFGDKIVLDITISDPAPIVLLGTYVSISYGVV